MRKTLLRTIALDFAFPKAAESIARADPQALIAAFGEAQDAAIGQAVFGGKKTLACFIDLDFFRASLKVNQDFMYGLLLFFADELQESERKMRNLAHMQVKGRVAQALLTLQEKFGRTPDGFIQMMLSRQDLASLVGATYETVFRIINELAEEQLIVLSGKNIAINDAAKLTVYTKE